MVDVQVKVKTESNQEDINSSEGCLINDEGNFDHLLVLTKKSL